METVLKSNTCANSSRRQGACVICSCVIMIVRDMLVDAIIAVSDIMCVRVCPAYDVEEEDTHMMYKRKMIK